MHEVKRRKRKVKIAVTLGPSSSNKNIIKKLFLSGADIFRLNMSHGTREDIIMLHTLIRDVEKEVNKPICIMADLQGPKLRCGDFKNGLELLEKGQKFIFDSEKKLGSKKRVFFPHSQIFSVLKKGSILLVNDGKVRLKAINCSDKHVETLVIQGGEISNKKGVNIPDVVLPIQALSKKDKRDLEFVCQLGIDWLALSFVQRSEDIDEARYLCRGRAAIISKIEKPIAVNCFDKILDKSDGIMIARGDLGVEMPIEAIPPIQKKLIKSCRDIGKPVIVATQMMESMINSPVPTRAEVSDVAQAIYEGTDAVMLSAESATGKYPVEVVKTMNNVAIEVENDKIYQQLLESSRMPSKTRVSDAITVAARQVAETTKVKAICCFTHSGTTALLVSREKPRVPIVVLTPKINIARRLSFSWGLHCVITEEVDSFTNAVVNAISVAKNDGFASKKEKIIVIAGVPFNVPGTTNILRVVSIEGNDIYE